jgi:hypothetical protein
MGTVRVALVWFVKSPAVVKGRIREAGDVARTGGEEGVYRIAMRKSLP